jgi:hypothetical protein
VLRARRSLNSSDRLGDRSVDGIGTRTVLAPQPRRAPCRTGSHHSPEAPAKAAGRRLGPDFWP